MYQCGDAIPARRTAGFVQSDCSDHWCHDHYLHGPTGIHAHEDRAGTWQYMLPDALGSVRAEINTGSSVQAMRHFAPYGEPFDIQNTFDAPFGFTGEPYDQNGLTHLRARYYDSQLGRFFQMDPSRLERNLYEYGLSNPVMNVDPSGLCTMGIPCPTNERMYSGTANLSGPSTLHPSYYTTANLNTGCGFLSDVDPRQLVTDVANTFAFNTQAAIMIASNPNQAFQIPGGKAAYALALGYLYYEAVAAASLAVGTTILGGRGLLALAVRAQIASWQVAGFGAKLTELAAGSVVASTLLKIARTGAIYQLADMIDDAATVNAYARGEEGSELPGLIALASLTIPDLPINYWLNYEKSEKTIN